MPVRKALVIGIDDYTPAGPGGSDLRGCVNDALDMANTLVRLGYNPRNIRLVTNRAATRAGIEKGVTWLLDGAGRGDNLVLYYSGHGSQVLDTSGDEGRDRRDEILCPHDLDFAGKVYVTDDDFRKWFAGVPAGVNLEVVFDCCHSGTGTRVLPMPVPGIAYTAIRYIPPPPEEQFYLDYLKTAPTRKLLEPNEAEPAPAPEGARVAVVVPGMNHVLWAGCRDNQVSMETSIGGQIRGVFTYHFCQVLRNTSGRILRRDLDRAVTAAISNSGFAQVPQLEGSAREISDYPFQLGSAAGA